MSGGQVGTSNAGQSSFGQFRLTTFVESKPRQSTTRAANTTTPLSRTASAHSADPNSINFDKSASAATSSNAFESPANNYFRPPDQASTATPSTSKSKGTIRPQNALHQSDAMSTSQPAASKPPPPSREARIRNPVPRKLKGKTDEKNGNFSVMHLDMTGADKPRSAPQQQRQQAGQRSSADIAQKTSEQTTQAAKAAQTDAYVPPKQRQTTVAPPPPAQQRTAPAPVLVPGRAPAAATMSIPQHPPPGPPQLSGPRTRNLTSEETKYEQARLLTLLRSINPLTVVDQICKALAFFGGIPGAPPPEDDLFPESAEANGSGALFVGWLSEIFPEPERKGWRADVPGSVAVANNGNDGNTSKRKRGRPKGSKATKVRKDKGIKKGPKTLNKSEGEALRQNLAEQRPDVLQDDNHESADDDEDEDSDDMDGGEGALDADEPVSLEVVEKNKTATGQNSGSSMIRQPTSQSNASNPTSNTVNNTTRPYSQETSTSTIRHGTPKSKTTAVAKQTSNPTTSVHPGRDSSAQSLQEGSANKSAADLQYELNQTGMSRSKSSMAANPGYAATTPTNSAVAASVPASLPAVSKPRAKKPPKKAPAPASQATSTSVQQAKNATLSMAGVAGQLGYASQSPSLSTLPEPVLNVTVGEKRKRQQGKPASTSTIASVPDTGYSTGSDMPQCNTAATTSTQHKGVANGAEPAAVMETPILPPTKKQRKSKDTTTTPAKRKTAQSATSNPSITAPSETNVATSLTQPIPQAIMTPPVIMADSLDGVIEASRPQAQGLEAHYDHFANLQQLDASQLQSRADSVASLTRASPLLSSSFYTTQAHTQQPQHQQQQQQHQVHHTQQQQQQHRHMPSPYAATFSSQQNTPTFRQNSLSLPSQQPSLNSYRSNQHSSFSPRQLQSPQQQQQQQQQQTSQSSQSQYSTHFPDTSTSYIDLPALESVANGTGHVPPFGHTLPRSSSVTNNSSSSGGFGAVTSTFDTLQDNDIRARYMRELGRNR